MQGSLACVHISLGPTGAEESADGPRVLTHIEHGDDGLDDEVDGEVAVANDRASKEAVGNISGFHASQAIAPRKSSWNFSLPSASQES